MSETKVRIENRSAHVKHIALSNGQTLTVPPTDDGAPGTTITFGDAAESEAFDQALKQSVIAEWVSNKDLIVHRGGDSGSASGQAPTPSTSGQAPNPGPSGKPAVDPKDASKK